MSQVLTEKRIDKLAHGASRREVPDAGQPGLYLILQPAPSTAKSWAVRYRHLHDGKPRKETLGAFPAIDLKQARKLAQASLRIASEGGDPAADRKAKRDSAATNTVEARWEEYKESHLTTVREATADAAAYLFKNDVLPVWGKRDAGTIRRGDVKALLNGMSREPAKAIKAKSRLHHFFGWLVECEHIGASPVAGIKTGHKAVSRERVLSDNELRAIWLACDQVGTFGAMVRVLILTLARRNEVAQMPRDELSESLWTIDGSRTKNKRVFDIHRTKQLDAILNPLLERSGSKFVFEGRHYDKPIAGFSDLKERLDKAIGDGAKPWTLHDLRRTGSTMMQRLGVRPEVIDACQNHLPQGVKKTYQRYAYFEERRAAFEALAAEVARIVAGDEAPPIAPYDALVNIETLQDTQDVKR